MIFTKGTRDDSAMLYGIVSVASCGDLSVYMKVTSYLDWIKANMKKGRVLNENLFHLPYWLEYNPSLE